MKLRTKMLIFLAFIAVIPVLLTAGFAYKIASTQIQQALIERGKNHLIFIRNAKKAKIEEYFNQVQVYANSRMVIEAMRSFQSSDQKKVFSFENIYLIDTKTGKIIYTNTDLQNVENLTTRAALFSVTGFEFYEDYHGKVVLSAFAPLAIPGLELSIFSNRQEAELLEPLKELTIKMTLGTIFLALVFLLIASIAGLLYYLRHIATPINHLKGVISQVANGYYEVRAELKTGDEFEILANSFNGYIKKLLIKSLGYYRCDWEQDNIIELLKGASQLIQCDLTVQIPVTGSMPSLADAINYMAINTSKVLLNMRRISEQMEITSYQVKELGKSLSNISMVERKAIDNSLLELSTEAKAMTKIVEMAQLCHEIAHQTKCSGDIALERVICTRNCFGYILETIHEAKEQMKHLNECIQGMNHLVMLINIIAECTVELASNKAVDASDANGGNSEMADEVLNLIESVLHAIAQILKSQAENNQIITTMAERQVQTSLVVTGLQLGEGACEKIKETQKATVKLAALLAQFVDFSKQQAQYHHDSRRRAETIKEHTQETMKYLETQTKFIDNLVIYAKNLRKSIQKFKFPKVKKH
jgi:methyl-accepting chemotaxis protein